MPKKTKKIKEAVNHPSHYNQGRFEVIDVIEDWKLGFCLGNTVKYIARAPHKFNCIEDLKKASWYLNREIQTLEAKLQRIKKLVQTPKRPLK